MSDLTALAGRIGGESSVFPAIRVRYSWQTGYNAVARWNAGEGRATTARGRVSQDHSITASENAVAAAWIAHVRLAEKLLAPRDGEDVDFWAGQLAAKVDPSNFVVFVADESDILPGATGGGYLVSFISRESSGVVPIRPPAE